MSDSNQQPSNANEGCVGPQSSNAGKSSACDGCPNQTQCSTGQFSSTAAQNTKNIEHENIRNALSNIGHVILVLSGKGGVGKSTVCCQLAHTLASRGYGVGVLDVDICGPSVARMLGCSGQTVHKSGSGWMPVYANPNLAVMSISFLLGEQDSAVVWRGPRKNGMIKQFLTETCWDEEGLDYLLIDTPPGTSDEHISTVQYLQGALGAGVSIGIEGSTAIDTTDTKLGGAVMVTTPEEVAMMDVRKELNFCVKTKLPVLGIVENMARFETKLEDLTFLNKSGEGGADVDVTQDVLKTLKEKCPEVLNLIASANVFPPSGDGPKGMASRFNVPYLGAIPLDPNLLKSCENGLCYVQAFPNSTAVSAMNKVADSIVRALPVEEDDNDGGMDGEMMMQED
jgi:Mrp family chromosome partitioning ATPase